MREKELRLALVCYGGISLAVHIHGVTRELHKLARASKLYFSEADPARRRTATFDALDTPDGREIDTERVYFDLLQEIGRDVQLKVVIDVIAGASAGGINGVMLGRALAHDLPLDALRSLWLDEADVERLMAPESRPGPLSKLYKRPVFLFVRLRNLGNVRTLLRRSTDSEIRAKLDYFLRARWFRPPFSGRRLSRLLLKACSAMGTSAGRSDSCLPPNQPLDLFVTVTDFRGYRQRLKLHDPAEIEETEHRLTLSFRHHRSVGIDEQGFNDAALPGLVFAARATSCFPGAFPPARLREIDQVCFGNARPWPERQAFIDRVLAPAVTPGRAAHRIAFIDGSVLNNKPFGPVIDTLPERVAHRQVDRRIVYVDPAPPRRRAVPAEETMPGFLRVISGALSVIPRNQPVRDELERLNALSEETRRLREVVDAARPSVTDTIARLLGPALRRGVRADRLADWRTKAHERAAQSAGFAYEGYLQLKLVSVLRRLAEAMARAPDAGPDADADAIEARLRAWAAEAGVFPAQADDTDKPWHDFLARFDGDYRVRRLRFVIRRINELYEQPGAPTDTLDALKGALYRYHGAARYGLERALAVDADAVLGPVLGEPAAAATAPAATPETAPEAAPEAAPERSQPATPAPTITDTADAPVTAAPARAPDGDTAAGEGAAPTDGADRPAEPAVGAGPAAGLDELARRLGLDALDTAVDAALAGQVSALDRGPIRRDILAAYLGYEFFDTLIFSITRQQNIHELDEVLVDRISPEDATALSNDQGRGSLKGTAFGNFGAFFSRAYREHDYLWGRLHGAERLVDIVANSAEASGARVDRDAIKRRLFRAILEREAPRLTEIRDVTGELKVILDMV